jgi:hypothetical protein
MQASGMSEAKWNELSSRMKSRNPSIGAEAFHDAGESPADPMTYIEAVEWAHSHEVNAKEAALWFNEGDHPRVDLRLSRRSLPLVSELLVSQDSPMATTAHVALQLNGAQVLSEATWRSHSTQFQVTFPNGTVEVLKFETDE